MVIAVAEDKPGSRRRSAGACPAGGAGWLSGAARRPAELEQVRPRLVDPVREPRGLPLADLGVEVVKPVPERLDDREVTVDHGVDEGIQQMVGPRAADPPVVPAEPLADRLQAVSPGRSWKVTTKSFPRNRLSCSVSSSQSCRATIRTTTKRRSS